MNWFGGGGDDRKESASSAARKHQRELSRAQRQIQRTNVDLEREEKKLEIQIKNLAKQGQTDACKRLAKQLVQIRNQKTRNTAANHRIGAIGSQAKMMGANDALAQAMASGASVMKATNDQINPEQLSGILKDFGEQNMKMDMMDEMMEESLNSILDESGDEEEQDQVVNKILDEIGIEVSGKLSKLSTPANEDDIDLDELLGNTSKSKAKASKQRVK